MALFEAYRPRGTWMDHLDPRTKLAWLILLITIAFANPRWQVLLVLAVAIPAVSLAAGIPARTFYHSSLVLVIITVQMVVIQLIFNHDGHIIFQLGPLRVYSTALPMAFTGALRITVVMMAAMQFLSWTPPSDLTLLLVKCRIPYRFAMLAGLALRFLPLMERELGAIYESQGARGLALDSGIQKLKGLLPVAMPFLYRSFRRAGETALAMELRGFGRHPQRTFLHDLNLRSVETVAIVLMGIAASWEVYLKIKPLGL